MNENLLTITLNMAENNEISLNLAAMIVIDLMIIYPVDYDAWLNRYYQLQSLQTIIRLLDWRRTHDNN